MFVSKSIAGLDYESDFFNFANAFFAASRRIGRAHVAISIPSASAPRFTNSRCAAVTEIIRFLSIRNSGFLTGRAMFDFPHIKLRAFSALRVRAPRTQASLLYRKFQYKTRAKQ
jgi:hypothetical protein